MIRNLFAIPLVLSLCALAPPPPITTVKVTCTSAAGDVLIDMPVAPGSDPYCQVTLPGLTEPQGLWLSSLYSLWGAPSPANGEPTATASTTFCVKKTIRLGPFGAFYVSAEKEVTHTAKSSDVGHAAQKVKAMNDKLIADGWAPVPCK